MHKLKLLTTLSIGIMASSTGMLQANAALYTFNVNFSTKEVSNFDDYTQMFFDETYNLDSVLKWYWSGTYFFDTCTIGTSFNSAWRVEYRVNGSGSYTSLGEIALPDLPCTTTPLTFSASATYDLPAIVIEQIMNDDANFIEFNDRILFRPSGSYIGSTLTLRNYSRFFNIEYDFNTTYLFNYFLSDQKYHERTTTGSGYVYTFTSTAETKLDYLYTTAGNDEYRIVNTDFLADLSDLRKKYAVDYNMEYFRGESIGAQLRRVYNGDDTIFFSSAVGTYNEIFRYFYLNAANNSQAIVDAPEFDFTYEDCGWDVFNIPCFINNGLAYITNDAPIISDAITLLNAGIAMAAQTFGIIGAFSTDNVFGYLILAGFGYLAVRWFLKND